MPLALAGSTRQLWPPLSHISIVLFRSFYFVFVSRNSEVQAMSRTKLASPNLALSQLWRVTAPRPDLENLCGHDTGGIRVLVGEV